MTVVVLVLVSVMLSALVILLLAVVVCRGIVAGRCGVVGVLNMMIFFWIDGERGCSGDRGSDGVNTVTLVMVLVALFTEFTTCLQSFSLLSSYRHKKNIQEIVFILLNC